MMKKKILLATIIALNVLALPGWAKDTVLIDRITSSEAEQLDIQIPAEVPPGHHEVQIEVSDDAGVLNTQTILFCKTATGEIKWDNLCPGEFAPFDPASDPKGTTSLVIGAFALMGAVGGAAGASASGASSSQSATNAVTGDSGNPENTGTPESTDEQSALEAIEAGVLVRTARKPGWGDKKRTWRFPLTSFADREFGLAAFQFSRFSPLMTRFIVDGTYLRAMIGSLSFLLYPIAIISGFKALDSNNWQAMPVSLGFTMLGIAIGLIDAYAGFAMAYVFIIGVIVNGNFDSRHHILTTIGVAILWFAPGLIASAIRPLRREIKDFVTLWERITDYALTVLLAGWGVQKMVQAIGGLSGFKYPIIEKANYLAVFAGLVLIVRLILEDVGTYSYPVRTNSLHVEEDEVGPRHYLFVIAVKALVFNLTAELFIGNSIELWIGTALFLLPFIVEKYAQEMPQVSFKGKFLPTGAVKIVVMILVGTYFASVLQNEIDDPHLYLRAAFVVLTLPSVLIGVLYAFANSERDTSLWEKSIASRYLYRLVGVAIFILLAFLVKGADVVGTIQGWFGA